ncbi:MAG: hypothetical protein ACOX6I_00800 [Syntrophomonadaceae bacterium]|jgi:hypothetical protein
MAEKSGLDISIAVFVHYRELNFLKYDAAAGKLKIEVALEGLPDKEKLDSFAENTRNSLLLYYKLSKVEAESVDITWHTQAGITLITLSRDIHSLSEEEIDLFMSLVKASFSTMLIIDKTKDVTAEEKYTREIKRSLAHNRNLNSVSSKNFFGFRDRGTMFVFNK